MGQSKRELENGYQCIDKYVCNNCVGDDYLKKFIKENGEKSVCDYCQNSRAKVVQFNEFIKFFLKHVDAEYFDPLEEFVSMDDGETYTIHDLLDNMDLTENNNLRDDVISSLSDRTWCEKVFWKYDLSEALKYGWHGFVNVVKHKSRYVFYRVEREYASEPIAPCEFLDELSNIIRRLGLYKTLQKGVFLYRVRIEDKKQYLKEVWQLAAPKVEYAKYSNRMSPAGIPMFYGAYDIGTAIKETYDPSKGQNKIATVAKFKLLRNITLIDFSKIPPYPRFFEESDYSGHEIDFLNDFVTDISKPIEKDGLEHIEYVPTQIVTEHIRYVHNDENQGKIYGLIYPSSKNKGKNSVVIFCENEHFVDKDNANEESFFELDVPLRRVNPKKYSKP